MQDVNQVTELDNVLNQAFTLLGLPVGGIYAASLAKTIHQAMSGEGRYYHTPAHALALACSDNPIQMLAALFHDVVYYQVDGGFPPEIWVTIEPYLAQGSGSDTEIWLKHRDHPGDPTFDLLIGIFGLTQGQRLYPLPGSNEFLSSLVMVKKLDKLVPQKLIAQIAAFIEATIPFRSNDTGETNPFVQLAQRLENAAVKVGLVLTDGEIKETIQGAVRFANQDVDNFSSPDPAVFLESTWMLLPEFNPALRRGNNYTVNDYRKALQSMQNFLRSIEPENVLHQFHGVPPANEMDARLIHIRKNLTLSSAYLDVKLLTVAILKALAGLTGGDGPISLFVGDVNKDEESGYPGFNPMVESSSIGAGVEDSLSGLLKRGVRGPVDCADVRTSPMALVIYQQSGQQKVNDYLRSAQEMFAGKINSSEFLQTLNPPLVNTISRAVSQVCPSRCKSLLEIANQYGQ